MTRTSVCCISVALNRTGSGGPSPSRFLIQKFQKYKIEAAPVFSNFYILDTLDPKRRDDPNQGLPHLGRPQPHRLGRPLALQVFDVEEEGRFNLAHRLGRPLALQILMLKKKGDSTQLLHDPCGNAKQINRLRRRSE